MDRQRWRVDGYIRVSNVAGRGGERFISPRIQREEIERWVVRHDAELLTVFEELNESGRRADRPLLEAAARRIEDGISDGIVVATVDRFGRSQLDGLEMIKRIQDAGGHFFSGRDDFDLGSEVGRYLCRELLSVAEFESDRLGVAWQQAKQKTIERGAWPTPKVPFGYRRSRRGRLIPDPVTGPVVGEIFARRAAGSTVRELCTFLEQSKIRTRSGNVGWALRSVEGMLRNRVYLGEIHWGAESRNGTHEPLTDGPTWERAQRPPTTRRRTPASEGPPTKALLRGLVRCASCSMRMSQHRLAARGRPRYRSYDCLGRSAAGPCPARAYASADALDAYVQKAVLDLLRKRRRSRPDRIVRAEQRLSDAEAALRRYRDNRTLIARLDPDVFADGTLARDHAVRDARLEVALARESDELRELDVADEIVRAWPQMSSEERRAVISQVIDCVFVASGRLPLEYRVTICPIGTAPTDLPRSGDKHSRARPFRPREEHSGPLRVGTARGHHWTNARLERELATFLDGRTCWPIDDVFIAAGRVELLQQARLRARDTWWAFYFHLPLQDPGARPTLRTEAMIKAELIAYLADKTVWPTLRQFHADGKRALRRAIAETGGLERWSAEVPDVPCPPIQHRWSEDRMRTELEAFCRGRSAFPTRPEFRNAGLGGLHGALSRRGLDWWAEEMGLPRRYARRRTSI
jgi:site-specific DNA recombinase